MKIHPASLPILLDALSEMGIKNGVIVKKIEEVDRQWNETREKWEIHPNADIGMRILSISTRYENAEPLEIDLTEKEKLVCETAVRCYLLDGDELGWAEQDLLDRF